MVKIFNSLINKNAQPYLLDNNNDNCIINVLSNLNYKIINEIKKLNFDLYSYIKKESDNHIKYNHINVAIHENINLYYIVLIL